MREVDHSPRQKKQHILGDKLGIPFPHLSRGTNLLAQFNIFKSFNVLWQIACYFQLLDLDLILTRLTYFHGTWYFTGAYI